MQHSNVIPGKGFTRSLTDAEIAANLQIVREMKAAAFGRCLTDQELDLIIAPVDSKRTRSRLKGGKVHQEQT